MADANVLMNRVKLIGSGYAEMPQDGRRFRFLVERYRHEDGTEWGQIVSMEEIPEVGRYLFIPSYGAENADEADWLRREYEYERANPTPEQQEWDGRRQESKARKMEVYTELRDERAKVIKRSPRTLGGRT